MKALEAQVLQVGNNLRTMEISEDAANQRESGYIERIKDLGEKYAESEGRAQTFETKTEELEVKQDDLDG